MRTAGSHGNRVRGIHTRSGEKVTDVLDADSKKEDAVGMLEREELIPYRLKPVRKAPNLVRLAPSLFKPRAKDIIDLTRRSPPCSRRAFLCGARSWCCAIRPAASA